MVDSARRIVTMGCGVDGICPAVFVETLDWSLDDPKGRSIDEIRRIRDAVQTSPSPVDSAPVVVSSIPCPTRPNPTMPMSYYQFE